VSKLADHATRPRQSPDSVPAPQDDGTRSPLKRHLSPGTWRTHGRTRQVRQPSGRTECIRSTPCFRFAGRRANYGTARHPLRTNHAAVMKAAGQRSGRPSASNCSAAALTSATPIASMQMKLPAGTPCPSTASTPRWTGRPGGARRAARCAPTGWDRRDSPSRSPRPTPWARGRYRRPPQRHRRPA